jgi:rhodanese-related sulfurtransferase
MKRLMILTALMMAALALAGCAVNDTPDPAQTAAVTDSEAVADSPAAPESVPPTAEPAETPAPAEDIAAAYQTISPEDAKELIGTEGVVLLDVRTQEEYQAGYIEGALLLPYDEIAQTIDKFDIVRDDTIIVYCRTGRRSAIAAEELIGMGYTSVYDMGGIADWPYEIVTEKRDE